MTDSILGSGANQDSTSGVLASAAPLSPKRRRMLQGGVAVAGGVMAASYVTPNLRSLGVPGVLAASGGGGYQDGEGSPGSWTEGWAEHTWTSYPIDAEWTNSSHGPAFTDGPPYVQTDLFNEISFFADHAYLNPSLNPLVDTIDELIEVAERRPEDSGGKDNTPVLKAAAEVVVAYLNASFFGSPADGIPTGYPYSQAKVAGAWNTAVANWGNTLASKDDDRWLTLASILDKANNNDAQDFKTWLQSQPTSVKNIATELGLLPLSY
jgi:hypothetical protein